MASGWSGTDFNFVINNFRTRRTNFTSNNDKLFKIWYRVRNSSTTFDQKQSVMHCALFARKKPHKFYFHKLGPLISTCIFSCNRIHWIEKEKQKVDAHHSGIEAAFKANRKVPLANETNKESATVVRTVKKSLSVHFLATDDEGQLYQVLEGTQLIRQHRIR